MLIILEGGEATWKTTISEYISNGTPAVPYRALRDGNSWNSEELDFWKRLGVPANTYIEDIYLADAFRKNVVSNAILDRSLPSGLAFDDTMWTRIPSEIAPTLEQYEPFQKIVDIVNYVNAGYDSNNKHSDIKGDGYLPLNDHIIPNSKCLEVAKWYATAVKSAHLVRLYGNVEKRLDAMEKRGRNEIIDGYLYRKIATRIQIICDICAEFGVTYSQYDVDFSDPETISIDIATRLYGGYQQSFEFT